MECSEFECPGSALPTFKTLTFALAGALVAFNAQLRPAGVATLSIAAGAVHGYVNGATMMRGGSWAAAAGILMLGWLARPFG